MFQRHVIEAKEGPALSTMAAGAVLDLKAVGEDGEFEGYASIFGNVDQGGDMVMAGAFRRTLTEKKLPQIKLLRDHDTRKIVGEWLDLREDDRGLRAKGRLFAKEGIQLAAETLALMRAKALDSLSI